tara:strand:- start:131 stop:352 length:222 start_codon:yes stop_codon:yes gene_type:complete
MLKKQAIRQQKIYLNKSSEPIISKDEVILLSENWNENEEFLFRKLLKQGGSASIKGTHFRVVINEKLRKLNEQ